MLIQNRKPKNARSKRALEKREPQISENPKTALFLRGTACSSLINDLLTDLHALKRPFSIRFNKKNPIHPFEDPSSLEFFSQKNDASLLVFGSHSKKRPHALTWIRCFGGQILDMLELCVRQETARTLIQFKGEKCKTGIKPLLSFSGVQFDSPTPNAYTLAKNMFTDFFRGGEVKEIDVEGLQLMISFTAGEDGLNGEKPEIQMRCWRIITKKSGQKVPRVEVEEMGPRMDFRVGRVREADADLWKEALKRPKGTEVSLRGLRATRMSTDWCLWQAKSKKNVETDTMGDKMGKIHLGRQNLSELQTRKMKGLKRARDMDEEEEVLDMEDVISDGEEDLNGGKEVKKMKMIEV